MGSKLKKVFSCAVSLMLLLGSEAAWSCVPGMMSIDAVPSATLQTSQGVGVTISSWYGQRDTMRAGTTNVENDEGKKTTTFSNTLILDYNVYKNWTAVMAIPGVLNNIEHNGLDENNSGVGDIALLAKYSLYRDRMFNASREVSLIAGIELPTGSRHEEEGEALDDQILSATEQSGSGTTNFIVGGAGVWTLAPAIVYGDVTYEMYGSNAAYQFGNALGTRLGASLPVPHVKPLRVTGEFIGHFLARDHSDTPGNGVLPDGKVDNSGSDTLFIAPGLEWRIHPNWVLKPAVQIPVYQNMRGTQLKTDYNVTLSLSTRFGAKSAHVEE